MLNLLIAFIALATLTPAHDVDHRLHPHTPHIAITGPIDHANAIP